MKTRRDFFLKRGQTVTDMESVPLSVNKKFFFLTTVAQTSLGGLFLYLVRECEWFQKGLYLEGISAEKQCLFMKECCLCRGKYYENKNIILYNVQAA
jgi:hypothetical protein